jgi:hypothetical protein
MSAPSDDTPRGDANAYDRYLRGMDASMRRKVALTAAHLLCEGEVADMGMGSGTGSSALAALYPSLSVIGVDLDMEMVERARLRHPGGAGSDLLEARPARARIDADPQSLDRGQPLPRKVRAARHHGTTHRLSRHQLRLWWVRLRDAVETRHLLQDGHLRIVALRAAHALGLLD